MQLAAHAPLQRRIDHLVLLDPAFATEGGGNHPRRIVVAVAAQVIDGYLGAGDAVLDQPLQFLDRHGHRRDSSQFVVFSGR